MSRTRSRPPGKGGRYHHGSLRTGLIDAALELIAEHGIHGFSLAEAARRLGVSSAAPYRHFEDRDELLAAIAVRSLQTFTTMLVDDEDENGAPEQRLAAMARAYVRFAAEHRAMFDALVHSGIDKNHYPELQRAHESVDSRFLSLVQEICGEDSADVLASVVEATAHGHAVLLLDGDYGEVADATTRISEQAARATLALIRGRTSLASGSDARARAGSR